MQEKIAKLEATIAKQGQKIGVLKKKLKEKPLEDNEYKRLIDRLEASEFELQVEKEELQEEVKELKLELKDLLHLLTASIEVKNEK